MKTRHVLDIIDDRRKAARTFGRRSALHRWWSIEQTGSYVPLGTGDMRPEELDAFYTLMPATWKAEYQRGYQEACDQLPVD